MSKKNLNAQPELSVVVPLYNEEENIAPLFAAVSEALKEHDFELVLVDDGSSDNTVNYVHSTMKQYPNLRVQLVEFQRNYGQTSAMAAGIDAARGRYIATMDGDLQNDPLDIPIMLNMLHEKNVDIVAGWRQNRKDGMVLRKIPSKIANKLIRRITGVHVHDYGCTLKLFRAELAKKLDLYGELHRFIPILGSIHGAKIAEFVVRHHPRRFGVSKYGLSRTFRVSSDLLLMYFFLKYRQRPMHLFGTLGLASFVAGSGIEAYLLMLKLLGHDIGGRPLFFVGIMLLIASAQFITVGFISELIMRTYYESQNKKPYIVKRSTVEEPANNASSTEAA